MELARPLERFRSLEAPRILIVQVNRLGDCILSTAGIQVLREQMPNARIHVLYRGTSGGQVFDNVPEIDAALPWRPEDIHAGASGRVRLFAAIRRGHYDAAVCFYASPASLWCLWAARVPLRITRHTVNQDRRYLGARLCNHVMRQDRNRADMHEAEYNQELLRPLGVTPRRVRPHMRVPDAAREHVDMLLHRDGVAPGERVALIHPGFGDKRPSWPAEHYAAVGNALAGAGARVVITGSPQDQGKPAEVAARMRGPAIDLSGRLNHAELGALMERAGVYVSVPTGPMHMAASFGVPVTVLLGQAFQKTVFPRWYPYGADFIPVRSPELCAGCEGVSCNYRLPEGAGRCMTSLPVEAAVEAAVALFTGAPHRDRVRWSEEAAPAIGGAPVEASARRQ